MADSNSLWLPPGASKETRDAQVMGALSRGRRGVADDPQIAEMKKNRRVAAERVRGERMQKSGSSSITFATARPRDPMFYWEQNNLPYDIWKPDQMKMIRRYCRLLYLTHPVISACIDIFAKYPLSGMELVCKDEALTEFYTSLFFDQLKWPRYAKAIGREYWTVGEAWPFGSFNETLGVWEDDELLNPDDIDVIRSPFLKEPRYEMRLPETLRTVLSTRQPAWEYEKLLKAYPQLASFVRDDARMPVSNTLLRQLKFDADTFHPRGIPILMRGFRAVMQEEMLNAAQDAIADRLYTPLVLFKLGATAQDLGTEMAWVPSDDDISDFEEALDAALSGDFRVLTHNFGVQSELVFGRENMPNFDHDFERLTERQLQIFGLSKTAIAGSAGGETYAGDALNRDYVSQLLVDYQDLQIDLFRERALVVAEAQEHYDYEERGGKRYPIMEEVWEVDEETGQGRIVEQPKLLVPDLRIKAMNLQDETTYRQLVEALRDTGVPISMKTRLVNIPINLEEELERVMDEQVEQAVAAQEVRKRTFTELRAKGLPIPEDLRADFEPKATQAKPAEEAVAPAAPGAPGEEAATQAIPTIGIVSPDTSALAPSSEDQAGVPGSTVKPLPGAGGGTSGGTQKLPRNRQRSRPPESDEQRARMPKASSLKREDATLDERTPGSEVEGEIEVLDGPFTQAPKVVGMRRWANLDPNRPLDEQGYPADYTDPDVQAG